MKTTQIRTVVIGAAIGGAAIVVCVACGPPSTAPHDTSMADERPISISVSSAPSVVDLSPNDHGYVRVETKSGLLRCSLNVEMVACQTSADNWPRGPDGQPFHVASVASDGQFHWVKADLGALEGIVTMEYQTYGALGWTIVATADGTQFTNDRTGHGMSASAETVQAF